jgi:glutamate--cysteine ligase
VGLLYNDNSLDTAWDLVKDWTAREREQLRREVPVSGLQTQFRGKPIIGIVNECLNISRFGLNARSRINGHGDNESIFLQELYDFTKSGKTNADKLIHKYNTAWDKDTTRVYDECRY